MLRFVVVTACLSAVVATLALQAGAAPSPAGFGSPGCLRGHWVSTQTETKRVMRALAPVPGLEPRGKLYMQFRDGMFQYGTTSLVMTMPVGDAVATSRARFFTLQPYTARRGSFTTGRGESTIEYGPMSATKGGRTYTVPGPPSRTRSVPGGTTPFQCRGGLLKVRLPRFASLNWITLHRT
jgi:hypothetical protein